MSVRHNKILFRAEHIWGHPYQKEYILLEENNNPTTAEDSALGSKLQLSRKVAAAANPRLWSTGFNKGTLPWQALHSGHSTSWGTGHSYKSDFHL